MSKKVKFLNGSKEGFDAIEQKDMYTFYLVEGIDKKELFLGTIKLSNDNDNLKNGAGLGSLIQVNAGIVKSDGITPAPDSTANGTSAFAFNVRCAANGDASIVQGYNSKAHTKADAAFNSSTAGITESEFNILYPNGYSFEDNYTKEDGTEGTVIYTVSYNKQLKAVDKTTGEELQNIGNPDTGYFKRVLGAAFAINGGKAKARYSFSGGYGTASNEEYAVSLGQNTKSNAKGALAGGLITSIKSPYGIGWGIDLNVNGAIEAQAFFGKYNQYYHPNYITIMEIGNGNSDVDRSNAFEVLWDGRAKVQSGPVDDNDVVRLSDVKNLLKIIEGLDETKIAALNKFAKSLSEEA